jgi:hypothetical protein
MGSKVGGTSGKIYGMEKKTQYYDGNATSAKFKDISHQHLASRLDVSGATREHWWMNQGYQNSDGDAQ